MRSVAVSGLVFCGHSGGCDYPATCAAAPGEDYPVDARCDAHATDMLASDVLAEDLAS